MDPVGEELLPAAVVLRGDGPELVLLEERDGVLFERGSLLEVDPCGIVVAVGLDLELAA